MNPFHKKSPYINKVDDSLGDGLDDVLDEDDLSEEK